MENVLKTHFGNSPWDFENIQNFESSFDFTSPSDEKRKTNLPPVPDIETSKPTDTFLAKLRREFIKFSLFFHAQKHAFKSSSWMFFLLWQKVKFKHTTMSKFPSAVKILHIDKSSYFYRRPIHQRDDLLIRGHTSTPVDISNHHLQIE